VPSVGEIWNITIFWRKTAYKLPLGSSRRRLEVNIKLDQEIGGEDGR
jgi:hypothetical protein